MGKTRLITLDLETYRTRHPFFIERISRDAIDREPAQNTKKEVKEAWHTEEAQTERVKLALEKTSCDVLLAEPLCVVLSFDGEVQTFDLMRQSEKVGLELLAEHLDEVAGQESIWCGHNVMSFDFCVLLNRWRHHSITPPEHFPQYINHYWRGRIFDTMLRSPSRNGLGMVGLDELCAAYGLDSCAKGYTWKGVPIVGAYVGELFDMGEYDVILDYCKSDVEVEQKLYMKMTNGDTWGTFDKNDELARVISEIESSTLPEATKAISILSHLDRHGLIPRAA